MKDIVTKINEGNRGVKRFSLENGDREELCEIVGYASEALGEEVDTIKFKEFRQSLSKQELEDLNNFYDALSDDETYPRFTNKIMTNEDINICRKLFVYLSELDEWDLSEIAETMGLPY